MKYPIKEEFGIYRYMQTPVMPQKMAGFMGSLMQPPAWLKRDKEVSVITEIIRGYQGGKIQVHIFTPHALPKDAPALVYFPGGGFVFGAAPYHYKLAKKYALGAGCKVIFVHYRLAPKHPFPIPVEDAYAAFLWTHANAGRLSIDRKRIAIGGDSAGGCLAAAVCQMCRDRGKKMPMFQLLVYPVTDRRMQTESNRKYTDTPMWHSRLSVGMWQGYLPDLNVENIAYASPMEASSFSDLPPAYVELTEFDCLHDEGLNYANTLQNAGITVQINDTKGTMHGFDIAEKTKTVCNAIKSRVDYMNSQFAQITNML